MADPTQLDGGCLCAAVRYTAASPPLFQAVCHCRNCQRQAGSAWSMIVAVPEASVTVSGTLKTYHDAGESGGDVQRLFCPECGSPLFSKVGSSPGMLFIKAGTLDDPGFFQPQLQVWTDSKQPWVQIAGVPGAARNPG